MASMRVSVVVTVYNEAASIERLLRSLAAQSRRPDEVVICDGGSRDGTPAKIARLISELGDRLPPTRVVVEPDANISRGRNVAIQAASGPIIAVTDAGVRLSDQWLEALVTPFMQSPAPRAVAGFFLPDVEGPFQVAMAATVLPLPADIDPARFLPSSRSVAFLKAAWAEAGGYPEWLDYCEDLVFDLRMNDLGGDGPSAFAFAPDALVYFRPRESIPSFWTQYYRYARGDGKADLWRKRHAVRYATYLVAMPALLGHAFWGFTARWLGWAGLLAGILVYCLRPWQRLTLLEAGLTVWQRLAAAAWVPVLRAVGDVAKMVGYPAGLLWRWRARGRPEIMWRRQQEKVARDITH